MTTSLTRSSMSRGRKSLHGGITAQSQGTLVFLNQCPPPRAQDPKVTVTRTMHGSMSTLKMAAGERCQTRLIEKPSNASFGGRTKETNDLLKPLPLIHQEHRDRSVPGALLHDSRTTSALNGPFVLFICLLLGGSDVVMWILCVRVHHIWRRGQRRKGSRIKPVNGNGGPIFILPAAVALSLISALTILQWRRGCVRLSPATVLTGNSLARTHSQPLIYQAVSAPKLGLHSHQQWR